MSKVQWPQKLILTDSDKNVSILIWAHQISGYVGTFNCWTYASYGLSAFGQPELIITLRCRKSENIDLYPPQPIEWFKKVQSLGKEGKIIDQTHTNVMEAKEVFTDLGWLASDKEKLSYVTYAHPIPIHNFPPDLLPRDGLQGILLTENEVLLANRYGYTRILSHLGLGSRWFPYAPWIDRDRGDCVSEAVFEGSLRGGIMPDGTYFPILKAPGISVYWEGERIILNVPPGAGDNLKAIIQTTPPDAAWILDSGMWRNADSGLYWSTGQQKLSYYGSPETQDCVLTASLSFCPQQEEDDFNVIEDGINLFLKNSTWTAIRNAIIAQEDYQCNLKTDDTTFHIVYELRSYKHPGTDLALSAAKGIYKKWHSPEKDWLEDSHVKLDAIMFHDLPGADLTSDPRIVELIHKIGEVIRQHLPVNDPGVGNRLIIIMIELPAGAKGWFTLRASPDVEGLNTNELWKEIEKLEKEKPTVSFYQTFSMYFDVWGK